MKTDILAEAVIDAETGAPDSGADFAHSDPRVEALEEAILRQRKENARLRGILSRVPTQCLDAAEGLQRRRWEKSAGPEAAMPSFDVRQMLAGGANALWVGKTPPSGQFRASEDILDPDRDYRMPAGCHQSFDLVCLVESNLAKLKAWPLALDEAIRLLSPGGVLVLRVKDTPICSIFALKNQIHSWPDLKPLFELKAKDGVVEFGVRNTATRLRMATADEVTFAVITDGKRKERLFSFLDSVRGLIRTQTSRTEVLVCGPDSMENEVLSSYPEVQFIRDPNGFQDLGWITRKKNMILDRTSLENVVICHDRYTMDPGFLGALSEFGGDFSVLVCRQVRPDGRRFPDWVTLGAAWTWSPNGMMEYGDWNPNIFINGGITIGKTAVLRAVRWNEFLFWNQAEDVELTRRLMHQGHVPRLLRRGIAVSHITREGYIDAFEPLSSVSDRYRLPGTMVVRSESPSPPLPFGRAIVFDSRRATEPSSLGLFRCEQWRPSDRSIDLPRGVYGELGGRVLFRSRKPLLIDLGFRDPVSDLEVIVNDVPCTPRATSATSASVAVPSKIFNTTRVLRINLRSMGMTLRLGSLSVSQEGSGIGGLTGVDMDAIMRLGARLGGKACLDGGSLCLSDTQLLARGVRRMAIFVPDAPQHRDATSALLRAIKGSVRPDTSLLVVVGKPGESLVRELGLGVMTVDWERYKKDVPYLVEMNAVFDGFGSELVVNALSPRFPMQDIMIAESHSLAAVGFERAVYHPDKEFYTAKYTRLLEGEDYSSLLDSLGFFGAARC